MAGVPRTARRQLATPRRDKLFVRHTTPAHTDFVTDERFLWGAGPVGDEQRAETRHHHLIKALFFPGSVSSRQLILWSACGSSRRCV